MNNTRNEQCNCLYYIEYSKRRRRRDGTSNTAEARERGKEYMRLYRARKNVTCYNQMIVAIVGTLTVIIRKYKNKRCSHVNYSYYHLIVARYIFCAVKSVAFFSLKF
jgi:hypothetical protein